jgi:alpha-tubulin suppressor-like RCC1 family protein
VAVDAALGHTCGLTNDGRAKCWGANLYGQLGTGEMSYWGQLSPVDVVDLAGATALSAGGEWYEGISHTCAVTSAGAVKCWGANTYGQLGNGTTAPRYAPFDVHGLGTGGVDVSAGGYHTCALVEGVGGGRGVKCWGAGWAGQRGDGTFEEKGPLPVDVSGLHSGAAAVSAGAFHTCAVTDAGAVKCWGSNDWQQLGLSSGLSPVDVPGFGSVLPSTPTPTATPMPPTPTATPSATPPSGASQAIWLPLICQAP